MRTRREHANYYFWTTTPGTFVKFSTEYAGNQVDKHYTRAISVVRIEDGTERILDTAVRRMIHQMYPESRFCGGMMRKLSLPSAADDKEVEQIATAHGLQLVFGDNGEPNAYILDRNTLRFAPPRVPGSRWLQNPATKPPRSKPLKPAQQRTDSDYDELEEIFRDLRPINNKPNSTS